MLKKLSFVFLFLSFFVNSLIASDIRVITVVNDELITNYDIEQRLKILAMTSGIRFNKQNINEITYQLNEMLIVEALQLEEARKFNLLATEDQIENAINSIAIDNKMTKANFVKNLAKSGINMEYFKDQIEASLSWQNIVLYRIKPKIEVSDFEIANYYESLEENSDGYEYLADIVKIKGEGSKRSSRKLAQRFYKELKDKEISFASLKESFSGSASESVWQYKRDFPEEIQGKISNMQISELLKPVEASDGYYLVYLRNKKPSLVTSHSTALNDKIYKKLFIQKLEKRAENYLRNLKQNSFIERKAG